MRTAMLTAKHCKNSGYHFSKKMPIDVNDENYLDYGVPFKFGFVNVNNKYDFHVPYIRTSGYTYIIQTFRDLDFKVGDKVRFDNKFFYVESVSESFINTTTFKTIKQYFITLK